MALLFKIIWMHVFLRNLLPQFFGKDIPFLNFQCRETNDVVVMFSRTRNVRFSNMAIICQLLSLFLICWPVEQYWPAILEFSHDENLWVWSSFLYLWHNNFMKLVAKKRRHWRWLHYMIVKYCLLFWNITCYGNIIEIKEKY